MAAPNTPVNLQQMAIPNNEELANILALSVNEWLDGNEWQTIFANADLFPTVSGFHIPAESAGLYRVEDTVYRDQNEWIETAIPGIIQDGNVDFKITTGLGLIMYDNNWEQLPEPENAEAGWVFTRHVVKNRLRYPGVVFVHYRYEWTLF